ncbi:hypothetical protein [Amycolatopsis sp. CA-126428]|uniref:hypothetical protein n=1 Tax=Amycolatopsis sp. CA-126428 TaxID=2073158 RepID=UPI0011B0D3F7|nr:hypothetical protein [Amycolatopsis sp. CA-126428]
MTVDYESLATLLPITFTALFAIAFVIGLAQQWAASRKRARATASRNTSPRCGPVKDIGRGLR